MILAYVEGGSAQRCLLLSARWWLGCCDLYHFHVIACLTCNVHECCSLPGVFFFYEVSPLHVEIVESYRKGYVAFFTSVCAVVGGVVTVMGLMDQWLFRSQRGPGGLTQ